MKIKICPILKTKIEINEAGMIAAATSMYSFKLASLTAPTFNCNHPFTFFVYDQKFGEILFAGVFRNPN